MALHILEMSVGIFLASLLIHARGVGVLVKGCWHFLVRGPLGVGILCIDIRYQKDSVNEVSVRSVKKLDSQVEGSIHSTSQTDHFSISVYFLKC
jgi:hypothetical protein